VTISATKPFRSVTERTGKHSAADYKPRKTYDGAARYTDAHAGDGSVGTAKRAASGTPVHLQLTRLGLFLVAALNMGQYLDAADKYMRLALKAQSQCRTTVEALGELKNLQPVAFIHQAGQYRQGRTRE
jgi:hypothetical protein